MAPKRKPRRNPARFWTMGALIFALTAGLAGLAILEQGPQVILQGNLALLPEALDVLVLLQQLLERNAHCLLDDAGAFHMTGDLEEFGAGVVGLADRREPRTAAAQDLRHLRDRLDVVDRDRKSTRLNSSHRT